MKQFKKNDKVIVRSNEPEPYELGTFVRYDKEMKSPDDIPMVRFDRDGKIYTCFSIVVPFSEEMITRLDKLTPEQQYELLWAIRENDTGKHFYIMHGLAGSGKSTKAHLLAGHQGQVFSADDFFCMNDESKYNFDASQLGKAHAWNQRRSLDAIEAGIPIVVIDNTNTTLREMRAYLPHIKLAVSMGYQVSIEEPNTEWAFDIEECFKRGTHNVPKATLQKMYDRYFFNADVEDVLFNI